MTRSSSGALQFLVAIARRSRLRGARLRETIAAFVRRHLPAESQHLFALTIAVGVVCGLVAVAFHLGIRWVEGLLIERAMHAPGHSWIAWTIASPTLGGLVAGALLAYVVPGARGSGIPQVKTAFALEGGRVRFRDAFGKFWIGILQIGSGASLGREGPTVQICAGATSLLARLTSLPAKNMRRLLPVGVAAGIAAAFNAPIAAVTFTIEEIVGSLDHAVLSGVVVAAALAAVIERSVLGVHPVIEVQESYALDHASSLLFYALLGLTGGAVSIAFTDGLLHLRRAFRDATSVPTWMQPAVGGLVTGALAVVMLGLLGTTGVTGGGYETLGKALAGQLGLKVLLALCVVKGVATVFSYSSGGAGGIFAPALFVGAMLGGAFGYLDVAAFHHEQQQLGAFALVGMGAVFAGVIRAPITSVLIIFEMTGGYGLVLPLMLANMTSYVLARRFRPTPIYEALLEQDGVVLPHATRPQHALESTTVGEAMTGTVVAVRADDTVEDVRAAVADKTFELVPVLDGAGAVTGAMPLSTYHSASPGTRLATLARPVETILSTAPLTSAVLRMNDVDVRQLVVLDGKTGSRMVGVLSMSDVVRAHARAVGAAHPAPEREAAGPADGVGELQAAGLAQVAPSLPGRATFEDVVTGLASSAAGVVIVRGADGAPSGVVHLEHVREFLRDEHMQHMLVAADLARPVATVSPEATVDELLAECADSGAPALVLRGSVTDKEARVVSRAALGALLLDRSAARSRE